MLRSAAYQSGPHSVMVFSDVLHMAR